VISASNSFPIDVKNIILPINRQKADYKEDVLWKRYKCYKMTKQRGMKHGKN